MKAKKSTVSFPSLLNNLSILIVLFTTLILTSCSTEEVEQVTIDKEALSIVEVLESYGEDDNTAARTANSKSNNASSKPKFKTLSVALAKTGLAGTVSSNRLTVFAPSDEAFAAIGLNHRNIVSELGIETLKTILLYHVVGDVVYSGDLSNGFVPTLNGASVEVNLDAGVMINDSNVIVADIMARNGVIHAIDTVLLPPMMNITELAIASFGIDSSLVQAVLRAELQDVLANGGPFTVFAPDQNAFDIFLADNGFASVNEVPVDLLTQVLLYHVVDGKVFSPDLMNGYVPTLNGAAVNVSLDSGVMIDDANVIAANIQATNGVVHVIDTVLFPPTMNLVGVASSFAPEFSILLEAATKAGLADTLMNGGPFTVFAPTNDAFITLLAALEGFDSLDDFDTPEEIDFLTSVLLYHVVNGRVYSSDLSNGPVPTLNGSDINVNLDSGVFINDSEVIIPNVQATNGVIHAINQVLVP
ncbi:fasciclin domain-containing protein [Yeosuana sp. MJ-SS3]|uniref:Fasciclin domain-containing protein n=1 Tax=Gilvirhabdus luticola TaxID=3079858 RepID=A0ABU3U763_9FLAO|nr:fasciclin domain-containing protein [Yeosuana sp. MJ-SS3]MDU8886249.1 fasciclin domain-containing protein [Yeosuana sp. MJ-SS3]